MTTNEKFPYQPEHKVELSDGTVLTVADIRKYVDQLRSRDIKSIRTTMIVRREDLPGVMRSLGFTEEEILKRLEELENDSARFREVLATEDSARPVAEDDNPAHGDD